MRYNQTFLVRVLEIVGTVLVSLSAAQAQQENLLYSFGPAGSNDGSGPVAGVVFDDAGNIYGTTEGGGANNNSGIVFELSPSNGAWAETILYSFCALVKCADGETAGSQLIFDAQGNLYGTTFAGGTGTNCPNGACGVVFELSPPSYAGGNWTETVLWSFGTSLTDGCNPNETLVWDAAGNLYGTTVSCGENGRGTVFELTPSGAAWTETTLYNFCPSGLPCSDGAFPVGGGVIFDSAGNLYGTTQQGGIEDKGVVYKLSPPSSGGPWTDTTLYRFTKGGPGRNPQAGLSMDAAGNLYGTVSAGGLGNGGIFELTTSGVLHSFDFNGLDGALPAAANPFIDNRTKTLYSITNGGGAKGGGTVFQIKGSMEKVLYNFCSQPQCADGDAPSGSLTPRGGKLYGTAGAGGAYLNGAVFEIVP